MRYDTKIKSEAKELIEKVEAMMSKGANVELKEIKQTRSNQQNRALHLYFTFISEQLVDMGAEFRYMGVKGVELSMPYTPDIVKNFFWRPIQKALFDHESTTELTSFEIDKIIDVVNKFFGEKGVPIVWPSYESLTQFNGYD